MLAKMKNEQRLHAKIDLIIFMILLSLIGT